MLWQISPAFRRSRENGAGQHIIDGRGQQAIHETVARENEDVWDREHLIDCCDVLGARARPGS
jgi:hypothetical protein